MPVRRSKQHNSRGFLAAIVLGDVEAVRKMPLSDYLFEARDDEHGETALMFAVKFGRDEITSLLLEAGADVNAVDSTGCTPLMYAKAKFVPMLLATGARIDTQDDNGETALMKAVGVADVDKVEALLAGGADKNLCDYEGKSAWNRANDLNIAVLKNLTQPSSFNI